MFIRCQYKEVCFYYARVRYESRSACIFLFVTFEVSPILDLYEPSRGRGGQLSKTLPRIMRIYTNSIGGRFLIDFV